MDKIGIVSFREVQHFRQKWIVAVIITITLLMWYVATVQLLFNRPFGTNPAPDFMLIIFWIIFGIGFPLFFFYLRLITEVRDDGIYLKFVPFNRRFIRIGFEEIDKHELRTYRPIVEYGGWGIKYSSHGNGKRVLIGTQRGEEFFTAVQARM